MKNNPFFIALTLVLLLVAGVSIHFNRAYTQDGSLRCAPTGQIGPEMYKIEYPAGKAMFFADKLHANSYGNWIFFDKMSEKWIILPNDGTWIVCLKEPKEFEGWDKG